MLNQLPGKVLWLMPLGLRIIRFGRFDPGHAVVIPKLAALLPEKTSPDALLQLDEEPVAAKRDDLRIKRLMTHFRVDRANPYSFFRSDARIARGDGFDAVVTINAKRTSTRSAKVALPPGAMSLGETITPTSS